jgi:FMN reductase
MEDTAPGSTEAESGDEWEVEPGIRIAGVCGSLRENGATRSGLTIALEGAAKFGVDTQLIELRDYELPFCGATSEEAYPRDVTRLRSELGNSHGIILGTPEYHGSMSGVLKNMLDLMSADQFEGKVVGLLGVAGGHPGAISSLNTMRMIGRNLHCWVLPQEVSIGDSNTAFDEQGSLSNPAIEQRLLTLGAQVVRLASLQQKVKQHDFMKMWQGLPTW